MDKIQESKKTEETGNISQASVPQGFDSFSEDEVHGGIDTNTTYLSQYPYRVKQDSDTFSMISNATDELVTTNLKSFKGVVLYSHWVYKLLKGTASGMTGNDRDWETEYQKPVAICFDNPTSPNTRSKGNFEANGFGDWLRYDELRRQVKKRRYYFLAIPDLLPKGAIAVASFGSSSEESFRNMRNITRLKNIPIASIVTRLSLVKTQNQSGETFYKVEFQPVVKDSQFVMSVKNADHYRKSVLPIIDKLQEAHQRIMEFSESQVVSEKEISYSKEVAEAQEGGAF